MATNPMQRKARNSFLLGMFLTLIVLGAVIAFLIFQMLNIKKEEQAAKQAEVDVYTLNQDVTSGQIITTDMLDTQRVNRNLVPANATSDLIVLDNFALQDKEGNKVTTKYEDNKSTYYIKRGNDKEREVKEEENGNYYVENDDGEKEYLELNSVPIVAKVDMKQNTVITTDLISTTDNAVQNDTRKQEYNMFVLPTDLQTGDYIDVRLMLPSGVDYIVVAKKEIEIPVIAGIDSTDTISMNLNEDEILTLSNAIVDAYRSNGAKLYVTRYAEPGTQEIAEVTYPVNREVMSLINSDPNIVEEAKNALWSRYNSNSGADQRNNIINPAISGEDADANLESGMQESITNTQNSRQEYLDGLATEAAATTTNTTNTTSTSNTTN